MKHNYESLPSIAAMKHLNQVGRIICDRGQLSDGAPGIPARKSNLFHLPLTCGIEL